MAAQIKAAKVSPCGNLFRLDFEDGATGPGPTDVLSVLDGCTLTVNGTPIALVHGFWPNATERGTDAGSWVQWPIGPLVFEVGIGKLDPAYSEAGGGWSTVTSSEGFAESLYTTPPTFGYRATADGAATARYAFSVLAPGRYRLSANLMWICGVAGRTTDAVYTVLDSDGTTVLATYHVDQTGHALAFNRVDRKLHLTDLGVVTCTGSGLTVVVSNNAGVAYGATVDDTFTRADSGTVGNGWVPSHAGVWAISGGKLVGTADGTASPIDHGYDLLRPSGEDTLNQRVAATATSAGDVVGSNWISIPVVRYNRTTGDKYFAFFLQGGGGAALVLATSIGGASAPISGGIVGMTPSTPGHGVQVTLIATGSSPTTLTATATDVATGTQLATVTLADGSATLQAAGGSGVGLNGGTAGQAVAYSEVQCVNLGAGGGSTLVADFLYAESVLGRTVPLGATCTCDVPANKIVCASGTVPAAVSHPVSLTVDMSPTPALSWLPYVDMSTPHALPVLGYNKVFPDGWSIPNRFYFNVLRGGTGLISINTASVPNDQFTGEMTGPVTGGTGTPPPRAEAIFYSNLTNTIDSWGYINNPRSTRWRVEGDFTAHGEAGGIPVFGFSAGSNDATIANVAGPTLISGNRWFVEADIALNVVPDPANWPGAGFAANYGGVVSIRMTSQINNISVTDVGNHRGWTRMVHPEFFSLMAGHNFGDIRFLDAIRTNASVAVNPQDLAQTGRFSNGIAPSITPGPAGVTVLSIAPVDLTGADTDDALKWFQREDNQAVIKVTTAVPHGLTTGHRPLFDTSGWAGATAWDMNIGGQLQFADFDFSHGIVVVLGPTTLLMMAHSNMGGKNNIDGQPPATLAGPHDMTASGTVTLSLLADAGETVEDCIRGAVECGCVPWICVPLTLDASALAAFVARALAATPLGQVIRVEHFNEPWNFVGPFQYMNILANHCLYQAAHGITGLPGYQFVGHNQMQGYSLLANICHKTFRAAWAAAGRDPNEVIRVVNTQAGFPEGPTISMLTWYYNAINAGLSDGFDEMAGECYQTGSQPTYSRHINTQDGPPVINQPDVTFLAFQPLDIEGTVSALGPLTYDTGRATQVRRQKACLLGMMEAQKSPFGPVDGQVWAGSGMFAAVRYINYEGGFDDMGLRLPLNDTRTGGYPNVERSIRQSRAVAKHPRMYPLELARLATLEAAGVSRSVRFSLNFPQVANQNQWYDYDTFNQGAGTGNPAENPNPFDMPNTVSQIGGAFRAFAATGGASPPSAVTAGAFLTSSIAGGC